MTNIEVVAGCEIDYTIRWLTVPIRWTTTITECERGVRFVDEQKRGPYKRWWHEHCFEHISENATRMTDRILYEMPLGPMGAFAHSLLVRRQLGDILDYRAAAIDRLFPAPFPPVDIELPRADTLSSTP